MKNNISIIGGGISGLVTALCFDKLEINYKLYERADTLKEVGAGIWLSPNALQVLEWVNPKLLKEIQNSGNSFDRILVANHKLKPISDSNQQLVKEKFGYTTLAIHRGKLQKILYAYVSKLNIKLNKGFKEYSKNNDETYKITFLDDTSILTKTIIGADGINSQLRQQIFPKSKLRYSGQTCWRGIADFEIDSKLTKVGFTLWGKKLQFGVSKLEKGKTYWFAVKLSEPNQKDNKEVIKLQLTEMFIDFHSMVNELIKNTSLDHIIRGDLSDLELLEKWYFENICLIGDAAHAMTPDLGQGGAQAIEDAYYISNFIKSSNNIENAFQQFYSYRKNKIEKLVKQSRNTSKIAILNKPLAIIRNIVLKNIPQKFMEKQMIEMYKIDQTMAINYI